jgi:hypothetical protein
VGALRPNRLLAIFVCLATLATLALLAAPAAAAPFDLGGHDWEGCGDFVELARKEAGARVVATSRLTLSSLKREDGIILIHPERSLDVESLARFMRAGGRIVMLDDFGTGDELLAHFALERVPLPQHPAESLRNNREFAIAEPASGHPVVAEVSRVVTNHATRLHHPDLSPVLRVRATAGELDVLLAVAGAVGQGRMLAIGDGSILINSMLTYPGNAALARGIVKYVGDDDTWGKRGGTIYVVSGDFEQIGTFGDTTLASEIWNERLRDARDVLQRMHHEGVTPNVAYVLAVGVGLGIVLWIGSRAGRTHRAVLPRFVRPVPVAAQGGLAGHAAVVAAPKTSRVLAMIELKNALEEAICTLLQEPTVPAPEALLAVLSERQLLDSQGLRTLKQLLLRLSVIETMVLSQRAAAMRSVPDREVLATASTVKRIVAEVRERLAANAPSRVHASEEVTKVAS